MKTNLFVLTFFYAFLAFAQQDDTIRDPVVETRKMLNNVTQDKEHRELIAEMSTLLLKAIVDQSKGNPQEVERLMKRAKANPDLFIKEMLTPEQQKTIRQLASEIDKKKQEEKEAKAKKKNKTQ